MDNNKKLIEYLSLLRDREAGKPTDEMNCELIENCFEVLLMLQNKNVNITDREIEERLSQIPFTETEKEKAKEALKLVKKKNTNTKKLLLVAAIVSILIAILSISSVGNELGAHDRIKELFGSVHNSPINEEINIGGQTFINNGKGCEYDTVDELLESEKEWGTVLFPEEAAGKLEITTIHTINIRGYREIDTLFSVEGLYLSISKNPTWVEKAAVYNEKTIINNLECYIVRLPDVCTYEIIFEYDGNSYRLTYSDEQTLIDIVENLKEYENS